MRQCTAFVGNCCERLYECISSVCLLICCCCRGKKACATSDTRLIKVGMVDESSRKKHNKIKTSKYTLITFLPKNLVEQFHRVVNFYFLIITVITIVIDSPIAPWTCVVPLSFMVLVSALKQGYEDWLRHRSDDRVNNKIVEVVHKGVVKEVRNSSIAPGTLVRVKRGREVPADLVLLCCAGERGRCHVTTANLDGETNLKTLRVPSPLVAYTPDSLPGGLQIEVPSPIPDLYTFYGRLEIPSQESLALCSDNLMLRGSRVKNTDWAIGCAVYTGEETKLALNSKYSGNKFSSCELTVNEFVVYFIILLLLEILVAFIVKVMLQQNNPEHNVYLGPGESYPFSIGNIVQDLLSFMVLYYYIIPMSLYVTIELFKFIGALFIGWDDDLRCQETGRPAVANTSNLNEELGQVEVLFSDKTGTLTKNIMVFKACSIKGDIYEEKDSNFYCKNRYEEPVDTTQTDITFFFRILALCHSVQISSDDMKKLSAKMSITGNLQLMNFFRRKKLISMFNNNVADNVTWNNNISESGSKMDYQASSPDEKALVEAADRVGVTFLGEDGNNLLVKIGEETEIYERLQLIEFTSDRKRMSVIVKDKKGKIWLFCKGAESAVFPICKNKTLVEDINNDINSFANKGLRTLAVAYREVPEEEYKEISEAIKKIDGTNAESLQNISKLYRTLEKELTLVGATAVEDCLQDDVADTLAALRRAGIRIWVLTGDKVETAISVAQSCAHISENDKRIFLTGVQDATSLQARLEECLRVTHEPGYRDLTLVVDGSTMSLILDSPAASSFVEISLTCNAVLCCRLSPIQKAKIVKLIKNSPEHPITAAIGDGANDISMIQEAHVGFGIFGKEGHQAARSADYAFTKFSMVKKVLLVLGHWYYQRLTLLIHYFFYKNLVLGNIMFIFGAFSMFSTQSIFDSMFLAFYNTLFTSIPCIILSVTDQRWSANFLLNNPILYRNNTKNKLMTIWHFFAWCMTAIYHSAIIFVLSKYFINNSVINADGKTIDLWSFGVMLIHFVVLIVNLELWLQARYHTLMFVLSVVGSILSFVLFSFAYTLSNIKFDGDVSGTYMRLISSASFGLLNLVMMAAALVPDFVIRLLSEKWERRRIESTASARSIFVTKL